MFKKFLRALNQHLEEYEFFIRNTRCDNSYVYPSLSS